MGDWACVHEIHMTDYTKKVVISESLQNRMKYQQVLLICNMIVNEREKWYIELTEYTIQIHVPVY